MHLFPTNRRCIGQYVKCCVPVCQFELRDSDSPQNSVYCCALSLLVNGKKRFLGELKDRDVLAGDISLHGGESPRMCHID